MRLVLIWGRYVAVKSGKFELLIVGLSQLSIYTYLLFCVGSWALWPKEMSF